MSQGDVELIQILLQYFDHGANISVELDRYIDEHFVKQAPPRRRPPVNLAPDRRPYRRRIRLKRYIRFQEMFKRSRKQLTTNILNDTCEETDTFPTEESTRNTYQRIYESESPTDDHVFSYAPQPCGPTFLPITLGEIRQELKHMPNKAAGPDYFKVKDLKTASLSSICMLYNFFSCHWFTTGSVEEEQNYSDSKKADWA